MSCRTRDFIRANEGTGPVLLNKEIVNQSFKLKAIYALYQLSERGAEKANVTSLLTFSILIIPVKGTGSIDFILADWDGGIPMLIERRVTRSNLLKSLGDMEGIG